MTNRISGDRQLNWLRFLADARLITHRELEQAVDRVAQDAIDRMRAMNAKKQKKRRERDR